MKSPSSAPLPLDAGSPDTARQTRADASAGFVMPAVLLAITALSLIAAMSYLTVSRGSALVGELQAEAQRDWAFLNAESETLFTLLTSPTVEGGYYVGGADPTSVVDDFGEINEDAFDESEVWSAAGGTRAVRSGYERYAATASLRDTLGLASLNSMTPSELESLFELVGASSDTAQNLTAKLLDYTDADTVRRFRGGERGDYRLRSLPPPSNAPLRTFEELGRVMDVSDQLSPDQLAALREVTIVDSGARTLSRAFIDPRLRPLLRAESAPDAIDTLLLDNALPSDRIRVTITLTDQRSGNFSRVIDIERVPNGLGKPFRTYLIAERTPEDEPRQ